MHTVHFALVPPPPVAAPPRRQLRHQLVHQPVHHEPLHLRADVPLLLADAHPPPAPLHVRQRRLAGEHHVPDAPLGPCAPQPLPCRLHQRRCLAIVQRLHRPDHRAGRRTVEIYSIREEVEEKHLRDLVYRRVLEESPEEVVFFLRLFLVVRLLDALVLVVVAWSCTVSAGVAA
uniref:Uncharacterized protein n=1 Tax=Arundo donax TaxID=35708 RepID=A0A0A9ECY0_ARUDO